MSKRRISRTILQSVCGAVQLSIGAGVLIAQAPRAASILPDAPPTRLIAEADVDSPDVMAQSGTNAGSNVAQSAPAGQVATLTREEAEQIAVKNNPRISVGRLLALAQHQVVRETRSAELPTMT